MHERYRQTDRQTTDGRATAYSEREREFTFAKNDLLASQRTTDPKNAEEGLVTRPSSNASGDNPQDSSSSTEQPIH